MAGKRTSLADADVTVTRNKPTTILVVDDDAAIRQLVTRFLGAHGFRILYAEDAVAAEAIWQRHRDSIDVLFTDVVMPRGISGCALAERLSADKPELQTIFTSGYNVELTGEQGCLREGIHFMQKPYRPEQLLETIRAVLNSRASGTGTHHL